MISLDKQKKKDKKDRKEKLKDETKNLFSCESPEKSFPLKMPTIKSTIFSRVT